MKIIIRVDASVRMGSGHVIRCLTLADRLRDLGANVGFICKESPGNLIDFIRETEGFTVDPLPDNPPLSLNDWSADAEQTGAILQQKQHPIDWLIIDHYALDHRWECDVHRYVKKIMVIDDLANRPHECDLLLDQNYYQEKNRYQRLVPKTCRQLLGPKYILFRKEFGIARKSLLPRNGKVRRILIFFGCSDPTNETTKALKTLQQLDLQGIKIDVIIGNNNQCIPEIERLTLLTPNAKLYIQTNNMAELIAAADLAIGSGGSAIWERHLLGLPTITIITADHQIEVMESVEYFKTIWNLGWYEDVSKSILADAITHALEDPKTLITMSEKALSIFKINKPDWIRSNLFLC